MKNLSIIVLILIVFQASHGLAHNKKDMLLGIVDSSTTPSLFKEGIQLAISSLNHAGGTLGKKWRALVFDDENSPEKGQQIAEILAANPDVIAVIGHRHPDVALTASIVYKAEKKLFISPGTNINLYGGTYIFRHGPDDKTKAEKIANYAFDNHFHNIIIFSYYDSYEKVFADLFAKQVNDKQMTIVSRKSFSSWDQNFTPMISNAASFGAFDAIFISGRLPLAGYLIRQIREMGIMVPILGSDNLDASSLSTIAGKSAENTIVPTIFDPTNPVKKTEMFVDDFTSRTGMMPDTWAAMAYDTVKLIAEIVAKSESCDPIVLDNNLRFIKQWEGVVGSYFLLRNGILVPDSYFFKRFHNGGFEFPERMIKEDQFELIREITLCLPIQPEIKTLDPAFGRHPAVRQMLNLVYTGLTGFDKKNKLVPMLASSWNHRDNHTIYTFQIRKNVLWSNHSPVTAHDVVATLHRNMQAGSSCPDIKFLYAIKNAKAIHAGTIKQISKLGVAAINDHIVEFTLEHPLAYFPEMLTLPVFWPLPSSIINHNAQIQISPKTMVTNGPYKLLYYEPDYLLIFRKNELFFNEQAINIPDIRFYVIPDGVLGVDHFIDQSLDAIPAPFLQIPKHTLPYIRSYPRLRQQYYQLPGNTVYSLCFNPNIPPVDDLCIRKAIMSAIDTYRLTCIVTGSGEYPSNTLIPPIENKQIKSEFTFNPEEAKNRLAEAGYPAGKQFPPLLIAYENPDDKEIAKGMGEIISTHLHINTRLTKNSSAHVILVNRKAMYYPGEYLEDLFILNPSHTRMSQSYAEINRLSKKLRLEKNSQSIKRLISTAENIMIQKEALVMPLFVNCHHALIHPRVTDWENRFQENHHLWQWSLRKVMNIK
jgi:ABC-type oligopeptide transport system substrate-binding subunit/ABC-type branched-subunit amino acid transport system substrate-binding protein